MLVKFEELTLSQSISLSFKYDPLSTITFFDKKRWLPASLALAIITQEFKLSTSNNLEDFLSEFLSLFLHPATLSPAGSIFAQMKLEALYSIA